MINEVLKVGGKKFFKSLGLRVEWRDRLAECIPADYIRSDYLPTLHDINIKRVVYFSEMMDQARDVDGDVVECGVSIGHGLLTLILLDLANGVERQRHYYGFDSFEGFPNPTGPDRGTHAYRGYYASPPEIVLRVLRDGRIPDSVVRERVHLVPGFFDQTLTRYDGRISVLHLDCDLYESYAACLTCLYDRVNPGGLILFDEYEDPNFPGARAAIDEFFANKPEKPVRHKYGKYRVIKHH